MGKGANAGLRGGFSLLSGTCAGCLRYVLLPALFRESCREEKRQ